MFPSEMVILLAIAVSGAGQDLPAHQTDVPGEYIGYLCDSLVKRGFLKKRMFSRYQLTPKGHDALASFLRKNRIIKEDVIKRLQLLGIEIRQKQEQTIDELQREVSRVM